MEGEGKGERERRRKGERGEEVMCWEQAWRECGLTSSSSPGSVSPAYSNQTRTSPTYMHVYTLPDCMHTQVDIALGQTHPHNVLHSSI